MLTIAAPAFGLLLAAPAELEPCDYIRNTAFGSECVVEPTDEPPPEGEAEPTKPSSDCPALIGLTYRASEDPAGVEITRVTRESCASRLGFRPGDLIVAANGRPIADAAALRALVEYRSSELSLTVVRPGESGEPEPLTLVVPTHAIPMRRVERPISPGAAVLAAVLATVVPTAAGVGMVIGASESGNQLVVFFGGLLLMAGPMIGPSVGLMAAHRQGRAWAQVGIRWALFMGASLLVLASDGETPPLLLAATLAAVGVGVGLYSIADAGHRAAEAEERWRSRAADADSGAATFSVAPLLLRDGGGVALALSF